MSSLTEQFPRNLPEEKKKWERNPPKGCNTDIKEDDPSTQALSEDIVRASDEGKCDYNLKADYESTAKASASLWDGDASAEASAKASMNISKKGCESMSLIAKYFAVNQAVMNCLSTNIQNVVSTTANTTQNIYIDITGCVYNGNLDIEQKGTSQVATKNELDVDERAQFDNEMNATLEDISEQSADVDTELGAWADSVKTYGSVQSETSQYINNSAMLDVVNQVLTTVFTNQNITLDMTNTIINGDINITQKFMGDIIAGSLARSNRTMVFENTAMSDITSKYLSTQTVKSKGLQSLVSAWFSGIASLFMIVGIGILIAMVVMLRAGKMPFQKMKSLIKAGKGVGITVSLTGFVVFISGAVVGSAIAIVMGLLTLVIGIAMTVVAFKKDKQLHRDQNEQLVAEKPTKPMAPKRRSAQEIAQQAQQKAQATAARAPPTNPAATAPIAPPAPPAATAPQPA